LGTISDQRRPSGESINFEGRSAVVTGAARVVGWPSRTGYLAVAARTVISDVDGALAEIELRVIQGSQRRPNEIEWGQVDITNDDAIDEC
jgi:NAD(P)-dependent dehydrogenase (short-subunit alcohol dehydrogenase family)